MEVRYMGFDQQNDRRAYRFDVHDKGQLTRQFVVTADIGLFHAHHVGLQEGPGLCARKLTADLEGAVDGDHTLTTDDLRLHVAAREAAEAKRIETRQNSARRPKAPAKPDSPWRRTPV